MARRKVGKVITTFEYRREGILLNVELRLAKRSSIESGSYSDDLWYLVDIDQPKIYMKDRDPEALRKAVLAKLDEIYTVTWARKIVVQFTTKDVFRNGNDSNQAKTLDFSYSFCDFGTTCTGERTHQDIRQRGDGLLVLVSGGRGHGWPTDNTCEGGTLAAIDYTPENEERVKAICRAFDTLGDRLSALLAQDRIVTTLENIKLLGLPFAEKK